MSAMRAAAAGVGVAFGFMLAWSGFADPDVIRDALLLDELYMYGMLAVAVTTGFLGVRLVRRVRGRAVVTGEALVMPTHRPERRHIDGALVFGAGWAVACACPGPIAVQLGQGVLWAVPLFAGAWLGILLHLRGQEAPAPGALGSAEPVGAET